MFASLFAFSVGFFIVSRIFGDIRSSSLSLHARTCNKICRRAKLVNKTVVEQNKKSGDKVVDEQNRSIKTVDEQIQLIKTVDEQIRSIKTVNDQVWLIITVDGSVNDRSNLHIFFAQILHHTLTYPRGCGATHMIRRHSNVLDWSTAEPYQV